MKLFLILTILFSGLCAEAFSWRGNNIDTDGSHADVVAAISAATNNTTIHIPAGVFAWGSVSLSKNIHLKGAGSSRVIGRSTTSITIGTGTRTLTTQSNLNIKAGDVLTIERLGTSVNNGMATGTRTWIKGSVVSYTNQTLVLNSTATGGSGTHGVWIIISEPKTIIRHNAGSSPLVILTENAVGHTRISDIKFETQSASNDYIQIRNISNGKPVFIHDCYFESTANFDCIETTGNRGVVWNCSFVAFPFSRSQLAFHHKNDHAYDAWLNPSTMGNNDDGTKNFYFEDCDFHAWLNSTDFDGNAKAVMRYCLFNNTGVGTHGADTGPVGVRHYEIYKSEFVFNGFGNGQTLPLTWWFYLRGGTGVIASNIMPDINSQDYGNKPEINMTVMNLQRSGGPNGCWGAGISGAQYPAPRQVGMGFVTGNGGFDSITYKGDSEPLYIWGNTGNYSASRSDYGGSECSSPDSSSDYIVLNRDYFINVAKPNWIPFTYPHPLRTMVTNSTPVEPTNSTGQLRWVYLSWNNNPEPYLSHYQIYQGYSSNTYFTNYISYTNALVVDNLIPGACYYFAAQAVSSNGTLSPFSTNIVYCCPSQPVLTMNPEYTLVGTNIFEGETNHIYRINKFNIFWDSSDGVLQFTTNLAQPNWQNLRATNAPHFPYQFYTSNYSQAFFRLVK